MRHYSGLFVCKLSIGPLLLSIEALIIHTHAIESIGSYLKGAFLYGYGLDGNTNHFYFPA